MNIVSIIARQRSGTNLLRGVLSSHPMIFDYGEICHDGCFDSHQNYWNFLERTFAKNPNLVYPTLANQKALYNMYLEHLAAENKMPAESCYLFDFKYNWTSFLDVASRYPMDIPNLFNVLSELGSVVIHLKRKNILEALLSNIVAAKNKLWTKHTSENIELKSVEVDAGTLYYNLEKRENEILLFDEWINISGCDSISFFYEDLMNGKEFNKDLCNIVASKLGLESLFNLTPRHYKIVSKSYKDLVLNYKEVYRVLSGTRFKHLIEML